MTPISHAGCGLAAGGICAPVIRFFFRTPFRAQYIIAVLASMAPDMDGLSLFFSHAVYFGKKWYSHHMFFHSIAAAALVSAVVALVYVSGAIAIRGIWNLIRKKKIPLESRIRRTIGAYIICFIAYCVHFLGDLPTPPGPWNGIAMYWPSAEMAGGWGKIYWHNWYFIYLSIVLFATFIPTAVASGILSSLTFKPRAFRYIRWGGYALRAVTVVIALNYALTMYTFISTHSYTEMGFKKWDALQRSLVPQEYMKLGDEYLEKSSVFWRKQVVKREDFIQLGNRILAGLESFHQSYAPIAGALGFSPSASSDMSLYRKLQKTYPGMEDKLEGDYRVWFIRDTLPNPDYFNRGFLVYYNAERGTFYLQMTNAMMILFRIDERDAAGNAVKVTRVEHTGKVFVPDTKWPQLNMEELAHRNFNFWNYEKIAYNLIPRRSSSRFRNTVHGLYPSINYTPGLITPNWQTGCAFHDGLYSEGCTVHCFGHFDLADHIQNPFYPLWRSADKIIDTSVAGTKYRGKQKVWGRALYVRNPETLTGKSFAMAKPADLPQ